MQSSEDPGPRGVWGERRKEGRKKGGKEGSRGKGVWNPLVYRSIKSSCTSLRVGQITGSSVKVIVLID